MATIQTNLVCDSSTLANFKQWAQAISTAFSTFGWTQSSDTGQVNWATIGAPPAAGAYVYEIWQPNDGLTNFYVKMEYGSIATATPTLRITISTGTNGAGTATGFIIGPVNTANNAFTIPSTTTQYECNFSGAAGRIGAMMWRNAPSIINGAHQLFAIERSVNASGSYTNSYVTLWLAGYCFSGTGGNHNYSQRSLHFTYGAAPNLISNTANGVGGWGARMYASTNTASSTGAFANTLAFDTPAPFIAYWDYPGTVVGVCSPGDFAEGVSFTVSLYGSTRTYIPSKNGVFSLQPVMNTGIANGCIALRYD